MLLLLFVLLPFLFILYFCEPLKPMQVCMCKCMDVNAWWTGQTWTWGIRWMEMSMRLPFFMCISLYINCINYLLLAVLSVRYITWCTFSKFVVPCVRIRKKSFIRHPPYSSSCVSFLYLADFIYATVVCCRRRWPRVNIYNIAVKNAGIVKCVRVCLTTITQTHTMISDLCGSNALNECLENLAKTIIQCMDNESVSPRAFASIWIYACDFTPRYAFVIFTAFGAINSQNQLIMFCSVCPELR